MGQHAAHKLEGEIVYPCLLGGECLQDLPAVVDLLLHRETRQPAHECSGWMQLGGVERQWMATAAPVHGVVVLFLQIGALSPETQHPCGFPAGATP